jgi:hypothetical protein
MEKKDESLKRLNVLSKILKNVYLPWMEKKTETKLHLEKFVKQISNTKQQAYGNVTIDIPEIPKISKDDMSKNPKLLNLIQKTVVSYCIIRTLNRILFYRNLGLKQLQQQLRKKTTKKKE